MFKCGMKTTVYIATLCYINIKYYYHVSDMKRGSWRQITITGIHWTNNHNPQRNAHSFEKQEVSCLIHIFSQYYKQWLRIAILIKQHNKLQEYCQGEWQPELKSVPYAPGSNAIYIAKNKSMYFKHLSVLKLNVEKIDFSANFYNKNIPLTWNEAVNAKKKSSKWEQIYILRVIG